MTQSPGRNFVDDSPRHDPFLEDRLGHAGFARRVAEALARQPAPNGYVVGIHGEWGSGKSTVLNFVRDHLERSRQAGMTGMDGLEWLSFDPWIVSGHQDLAAAFFKRLSEKLGGKPARLARWKQRAAAALNLGAPPLIDAVSKLGVALDGGVATGAGGAIAKAGARKAATRWLAQPSLQKSYDTLGERLRASGKRFIVFIDDIDRLTADEIRALMQMIKTVGRLPNVTYCLAYDRQIVWSALRTFAHAENNRSGYAEKIVQHEIEVPVPGTSALMRLFEEQLPPLPAIPPHSPRWIELFHAGIARWLRHPRDAVRFANAMRFAWGALADEIDPHDLLCMEGLRLFDRPVFEWIRANRSLLLGEGVPRIALDEAARDAEKQRIADLGTGARAEVLRLLTTLFPNHAEHFGAAAARSGERWSDVMTRRGIATPPGYTAYFSLAPSASAVPKRMLDDAMKKFDDRAAQVELLDTALDLTGETGNSLIGAYLQELQHRIAVSRAVALGPLLAALLDRTEAISAANGDEGAFGPSASLYVLVADILEKLGPEAAADELDHTFAEPGRLGALCFIYVIIGRALGLIATEGATRQTFIAPERFAALGAQLLPRIEQAVSDGSAAQLPHYYELARAWAHLAGTEPPRAWLANLAAHDAPTLAKVADGMLGRSLGNGGGVQYGLYARPDTDLYDIDALLQASRRFDDVSGLIAADAARITALRYGLEAIVNRRSAPEPGSGELDGTRD